MNSKAHYIQRFFAAIVLIMALVAMTALFSKVFSNYKKSTGTVNIYQKLSSEFDHHHPHLRWLPDDDNIEGNINPYLRKEIMSAYLKSWASANLSQFKQQDFGLVEHFTDDLRRKINPENFHQLKPSIIESTDLNHEIKLHFISYDKQVVSFTDKNVRVLNRYKTGDKTTLSEESFSYEVVMTLDDGVWRIDKMLSIPSDKPQKTETAQVLKLKPSNIKGINYYPSQYPWKKFWEHYPEDTVAQDLKVMKSLGFNTVRIFIPFIEFGGPYIPEERFKKLDHFLSEARKNKIYVMPTLFDFPVGFELIKYTGYDRYLKSIMNRYHDNRMIIAWDIKNEPDLDFEYHSEEIVLDWLSFIIVQIRKYDKFHPITIGWAHPENAHHLHQDLDFISFHYYRSLEELENEIKNLKAKTQTTKLVVSEYGMTTYDGIFPGGHTEKEQSEYIAAFKQYLKKNKIGYCLWSLYDYSEAPSDVFGWKPWIKANQKQFGIIKADGSLKPSALKIKKSIKN